MINNFTITNRYCCRLHVRSSFQWIPTEDIILLGSEQNVKVTRTPSGKLHQSSGGKKKKTTNDSEMRFIDFI